MTVLFQEIERFGLDLEKQIVVRRLDCFDTVDVSSWDNQDMSLCGWPDIVEG